MNKFIGIVICIMFSLVLILGNVYAEDAVIQELQSDVSDTKSKAENNKADRESIKGGLPVLEDRVTDIELKLNSWECNCDITRDEFNDLLQRLEFLESLHCEAMEEVCDDLIDNDCDGVVDEGCESTVPYFTNTPTVEYSGALLIIGIEGGDPDGDAMAIEFTCYDQSDCMGIASISSALFDDDVSGQETFTTTATINDNCTGANSFSVKIEDEDRNLSDEVCVNFDFY